jgi:hypothetical protein
MLRNTFIIGAICLLFSATSVAQTYQWAAGIRYGEGVDLTGQFYIRNGWTTEAIVHTSFYSKNLGATLMAQKHRKILIRNLNYYYGGGFHYYVDKDPNRRSTPALVSNVYGLTGIAGAELSLGRLNLAVDIKPELHLGGDQTYPLEWTGVSLSARYIFAKRRRSLRDRFEDERDDWRDRRDRDRRGDDDRRGDRRRWRI